MRKIKLMFFIVMAVLFGLSGNSYAKKSWGCDCSSSGCHSSRPSQCEPPPVNSPPVANAGPNQKVDEEISVTLNGSNSSDPDDNIAYYFWKQIPTATVTLSDPNAIRPTFIAPAVDLSGVALKFRLTVTDLEGLESSDECIVNVSWVNQAPTANAGADQTVDENVVVTLDGSNSVDPDDGIASHMWREVGKTSVTLTGADTANPSFTAPFVDLGSISLNFELTVTDNGGLKSTDTSVVNVSWVNEAPTADAGTDQNVEEGSVVTLDASNSSDPDDGIGSYLWTQIGTVLGDSMTLGSVTLSDPAAIKPTFEAPAVTAAGASLTFQVTVKDKDGLQSTDTCIVNVNPADLPPVNEGPTADAGKNQTVDEGDIVTLDASNSSDPDDGIGSYLWTQIGTILGDSMTLGSVTLSDPTDAKPTFEAPAVAAASASLTFQVTVTDIGGLQSTDTCIVNVNAVDDTPVNQPPTADAGDDQTFTEGELAVLDGSNSSDPDGIIASYLWKQTAGRSVTLSDPYAVKPTFEAPAVGKEGVSMAFQITVTDIGGLQSTDTCEVKIKAADIPDDDISPPGDIQERLKAVRQDLKALAQDREYSRKLRKMFRYSARSLYRAEVLFEKGKNEYSSKTVGKAIYLIKKAAGRDKRDSELQAMCEEFIQDLEKLKAAIKGAVISPDDDDDDDDSDDDDDRDDHDDSDD